MAEINIVLGLGFGDEGKGKIVQKIAKEKTGIVVRTSGGPNCGHNVYYEKRAPHTFSTYGSGTFEFRKTFIGENTLIAPDMAWKEYIALNHHPFSRGLSIPTIHADPFCEIITPYDVIAQQSNNDCYGKTTGKGIGTTKKRIQDGIHLTFGMCKHVGYVKTKLESIRKYYGIEETVSEQQLNDFFSGLELIYELPSTLEGNVNYTFEGNQGFFLDEIYGLDEYNTWGDCTIKSPLKFIKKYLSRIQTINVHYVTRSYLTRHGQGSLPNEGLPRFTLKDSKWPEHNVKNIYQGPFRTSKMDFYLIKQAVNINRKILKIYNHLDFTEYLHVNHTDIYDSNLNDFQILGIEKIRFYADPY